MTKGKNDTLGETNLPEENASMVQVREMLPEDIAEEGSLALLALGYEGIMLWRQKVYGKSTQQKHPS